MSPIGTLKWTGGFLLFLSCLWTFPVWSEPPSPTPQPTATTEPEVSSPLDQIAETQEGSRSPLSPLSRAELRVDIAKTTFELDPSIMNRATLLHALERVVELTCMPRLTLELQYSGGLSNPACMEQVLRVFAIDSASPVAFCARDGIDSENCLTAYRAQVIGPLGDGFTPPSISATQARPPGTRMTIGDTSAALLSEARALRGRGRGKEGFQNRLRMRALYDRLLTLNCSTTRLALREAPPQQDHSRAIRDRLLSQPLAPSVPIEQYVDALTKTSPTGPSQEPEDSTSYGPAHYRMRMLPDACMFYLREAEQAEKTMATVVCHRDGFSSPACVQAIRDERARTASDIQAIRAAEKLPTLSPRELERAVGVPNQSEVSGNGRPAAPGFSTF